MFANKFISTNSNYKNPSNLSKSKTKQKMNSNSVYQELELSTILFKNIPEISLHDKWELILKTFPLIQQKDIYSSIMKTRNYYFAMAYDQMLSLSGIDEKRPWYPILIKLIETSIFKVRITELSLVYMNLITNGSGFSGEDSEILGLAVALYRIRVYLYKIEKKLGKNITEKIFPPFTSWSKKEKAIYVLESIEVLHKIYNGKYIETYLNEKNFIKEMINMSSILNKHLNNCIRVLH